VSSLIDERTRVLVQGITGSIGRVQTRWMLDSGTRIVAGVTPGRGGERVERTALRLCGRACLADHAAAARLDRPGCVVHGGSRGRDVAPQLAPAAPRGWAETLGMAALLGLVAYGTYDLTNLATVKAWPWIVTLVDMAWGTVLATAVAGVGYAVGHRLALPPG
jgi:hypothetical protein